MRILLEKFFAYLVVFLVSGALIGFAVVVNIGLVGLPENLNHFITFVSIGLVTFYSLSITKNKVSPTRILMTITAAWLALFVPKALMSSSTFTLTNIPFFISFLLALGAGYSYYKKRAMKLPILMGLIPLILTLGLASKWNNKVVYGTVNGQVESISAPAFSVTNKSGSILTNASTQGKIVVMDFWFIGCPPCWVKFPELQRIYEQYHTNDRIVFYAVNSPMRNDKPDQLFTSIEAKNYTFPVVRGTEALMNVFEIDYYPTVIIIDASGNMVFKGEIEDAEKVIKNLLNKGA